MANAGRNELELNFGTEEEPMNITVRASLGAMSEIETKYKTNIQKIIYEKSQDFVVADLVAILFIGAKAAKFETTKEFIEDCIEVAGIAKASELIASYFAAMFIGVTAKEDEKKV